MATWKQVILKDPVTGEYLAPLGGNYSGGDADTLQSHPASDFLLKTEYTPVDLSEYLKTATADTKYAAASHTHTTGQISDLSTVLAGYAPASHTHEIGNINGLQTELNSLKSSVSEGKSLVAAAVTDKGITTAADAAFQTIANNIGKLETQEYVTVTMAGNSPGSADLTFYGFTVEGDTNSTFQVPKNSCIKAYVGKYYLYVSSSGGTQVASNSDKNGNWEYIVVVATSPVTITVTSSRV